jgi:hypothetical protein
MLRSEAITASYISLKDVAHNGKKMSIFKYKKYPTVKRRTKLWRILQLPLNPELS